MQVAAVDTQDKKEFLDSPFIKDSKKTINDLVNEYIQKLGENIQVGNFIKFTINCISSYYKPSAFRWVCL